MRAFTLAFAVFGFAACATYESTKIRSFVAAPNSIDQQRAPSIEDYILALSPYSSHEESLPAFASRLRSARSLPQNQGKSSDYLYCPATDPGHPKSLPLNALLGDSVSASMPVLRQTERPTEQRCAGLAADGFEEADRMRHNAPNQSLQEPGTVVPMERLRTAPAGS
jgi:hypothetical protein